MRKRKKERKEKKRKEKKIPGSELATESIDIGDIFTEQNSQEIVAGFTAAHDARQRNTGQVDNVECTITLAQPAQEEEGGATAAHTVHARWITHRQWSDFLYIFRWLGSLGSRSYFYLDDVRTMFEIGTTCENWLADQDSYYQHYPERRLEIYNFCMGMKILTFYSFLRTYF